MYALLRSASKSEEQITSLTNICPDSRYFVDVMRIFWNKSGCWTSLLRKTEQKLRCVHGHRDATAFVRLWENQIKTPDGFVALDLDTKEILFQQGFYRKKHNFGQLKTNITLNPHISSMNKTLRPPSESSGTVTLWSACDGHGFSTGRRPASVKGE